MQNPFPAGGQEITFACPASGYYLVRNYTHSPFQNSSDGATAFPWSRQNCPAGQGRWEHIHLTHKYVISLNRLFTKAPDDVHNLFPVEITFARPAPSSGHYLVRNYTHSPWSQAFQNFSDGANTSPRSRQDFLADQGRWGRTSGWWFRPSPPRWTAVCPSLWPSPPSRSLQPLWKILVVSNSTLKQSPSTPEARRSL